MTDEQQPVVPTPEPTPTPVNEDIKDSTFPTVTKLDNLPEHMREMLNAFIKIGYGSQKIKTEFERKFPQYDDILPASRGTYAAYVHNHYDAIMQDAGVAQAAIDAVRQGLEQAVDLADSVLGENNASKKEQIESLKAFMVGRIEFLQRAQSTGIPNAQLENTIASYVSGVRTLIEKSIEYGQELNQEDENQVEVFMESLIDEMLENIVEIYKTLHGDNKLQEFQIAMSNTLAETLTKALQQKNDDDEGAPQQ